ncbi:T-cell surface antigen CD2 isoform X1 [Alligator sinensis]|uniref:T-cell surface antigen CD2 isoform X1 n=1 Tax=Alligator sinensis TaxID=38654 RepID=A0A1U8CYH2_ALLSI|nr:T-cell surface antigen CD2 isoform X1 [Alligator sinensis]
MVLKMNFKEIFLAKYLVILFFSVKGSLGEPARVSAVLNESVFLNISNPLNESTHDIRWFKDTNIIVKLVNSSKFYYSDKKKYYLFPNGTLKIEQLLEEDGGSYKVEVFCSDGTLKEQKDITLSTVVPVPQPLLTWDCTRKQLKLTCEVKQEPKPFSQLVRYEGKSLQATKEWKSANGFWNMEYQEAKNASGKYTCIVSNSVTSKYDTKDIQCAAGLDLLLILCIAGGAVVFVIILVLLIYYIRRKTMEHYEEEDGSVVADEDIPVQIYPVEDGMKQRELPRPPGHAPQRQPRQPQRPPPQSQPQAQQLAAPPRPRPRTQQRAPNRIKERT